jgi:hypothetical protein
MRTIDLRKEDYSIAELLALAKSGAILIHSASGDDFLLEEADELDREAAALGKSDSFMSFLEKRSAEAGEIPLSQAAKKRGLEDL